MLSDGWWKDGMTLQAWTAGQGHAHCKIKMVIECLHEVTD